MSMTVSIRPRTLCAVIAFRVVTTAVQGANVTWVGDTGSNDAFELGSNWDTGTAPGASDKAQIMSGASIAHPVVLSQSDISIAGLLITSNAAARITSGNVFSSSAITIGDAAKGTLLLDTGTFGTGQAVTLGSATTGEGALIINNGLFVVTNSITIGNYGQATVVLNGGVMQTINNNNNFRLGVQTGAKGTLILSNGLATCSYAVEVGYGGVGELIVAGGTNTMARQIYVGNSAGATGYVHCISGALSVNYDSSIGRSGSAFMTLEDTFPKWSVRGVTVGENAAGVGIITAGPTTLQHQGGYGITIGALGHGEFYAKGTSFSTDKNGVKIRTDAAGFGLLRGWGTGVINREAENLLQNNGLIIADGEGMERDLDFSSYTQTSTTYPCKTPCISTIENDSTNGFYAVNKGRFLLGGYTLTNAIVNWCEGPADEAIDMVNSARFVFSDDTVIGKKLTGSLYAADRSDIPDALSGVVVGVWDFALSGAFDVVTLQLRYDNTALGRNTPKLLHWNTTELRWENAHATLLPDNRLEVSGLTELGFFAVVGSKSGLVVSIL